MLAKQKLELLTGWKTQIENEFAVRVNITVEWGRWRSTLLSFAEAVHADLIVIHEKAIAKNRFSFAKTHLSYIIEKSPCQVITLLDNREHKNKWQQVVIPVSDDIPELHIQTIIDTAKSMKL
ncbi:MAG: hypothetical protein V4539_21985 [Bacteroidota bacterium]